MYSRPRRDSRERSGRRKRSRSFREGRERERRSFRPVATASRSGEMPNRWSRREEGRERNERDEVPNGRRWEREKLESHSGSLQPLPRPGIDEDRRLEKLNDDPRYHPGAELGKAQKAAMGIKGLHGRNTASFDPHSTLVRPAMRIIYGRKGHEFGSFTKPDDVVVVPEFLCDLRDHTAASHVIGELKKSAEELDPKALPSIGSLTARMCQYFQVNHEEAEAVGQNP